MTLVRHGRRIHAGRARRRVELREHRLWSVLVGMAWVNRLRCCWIADDVKDGIKGVRLNGDGGNAQFRHGFHFGVVWRLLNNALPLVRLHPVLLKNAIVKPLHSRPV